MAGNHTLPELNYAYDALEPFIDEQTMRLHHSKHHMGYVNGLNAAEKGLKEARESGDFGKIRDLERLAAFHGSGHFNHCLFWQNMTPADNYKDPSGDLIKQINKDFGSLDGLKAQFGAAAKAVEGSGWGLLCWQPAGEQLVTLAAENHQKQTQFTAIPVLALDVWEHAYYLKYQNARGQYVDQWWNVVNWENVAENLARATQYKFELR
ncbi:superoxide dismutase [Bradymonadaceae bacterium TMQ3]|uniref:Superoxide dismutase n=1 Tax=Lujinxingia sediminis TaxID=2480984 RepID=A0ABY0CW72_9DELT|nr:superoxide dismutase [Lujinxingia sediminis]RDV37188.1 superoxide dismutase [Bradymonadaceae bacterium TMQ3]RVU46864.1 superoxide dismutase [Lujinxingia sediminis]TXC74873.1 superoxide dismutase [Bradymonadales bacterium TMQ1]